MKKDVYRDRIDEYFESILTPALISSKKMSFYKLLELCNKYIFNKENSILREKLIENLLEKYKITKDVKKRKMMEDIITRAVGFDVDGKKVDGKKVEITCHECEDPSIVTIMLWNKKIVYWCMNCGRNNLNKIDEKYIGMIEDFLTQLRKKVNY